MLTGETLGPYRVLEKLGEGGMGEVYRLEVTLDGMPLGRRVGRAGVRECQGVLFKGTYFDEIGTQWAVTRDDKRFLTLKPSVASDGAGGEQARPQITIVLNWAWDWPRSGGS